MENYDEKVKKYKILPLEIVFGYEHWKPEEKVAQMPCFPCGVIHPDCFKEVGVSPGADVLVPISQWNKNDRGELVSSKRKFKIIDEKQVAGQYEELLEFEDDQRNPVWVEHKYLVGSDVKKL